MTDLLATYQIVNALIDHAPAGVVAVDRELRVAFASPELGELLGPLERGQPLGHANERAIAVASLVARVRDTGEAAFEVSVGSHAPLVASAYPIAAAGELGGVCCVVEDGARDRRATELLDNVPLAIGIFEGPQHRPRLLNRTWQERLGTTGVADLRLGELDRVYATQETVHFADTELSGDAERYTGLVAPVRTALGVVRGVMVICTERADVAAGEQDRHELARRALVTAQDDRRGDARVRDQFLASVAHELRSPIHTVLLWEKILREVPGDHELHARALDAIHDSAVTQARLVDDLLDISRAVSGKLRVDLRPLEIGAVLASAITDVEPAALAKHQHLEQAVPADLGLVSGDVARLRQILRNLLSNAIKFTADGGPIRVSAQRADGRIVIEVTDAGRGIAPEFLPRIFEPFNQGEDALARSHDGLGLGLAISYQLVAAHAGQLSARSGGTGHGATFTLVLPCLAPRAATPAPSPAGARLAGLRLLVVDDDHRVLDALQVLLQSAGATVELADSVAEGFGTLQRSPPDVVLSDLAMPQEDGYSFMRRIRALPGEPSRVPAVAITGHSTDADRARALAAGFDLYVTKPVNVDHLISTIVQLVEIRRHEPAQP